MKPSLRRMLPLVPGAAVALVAAALLAAIATSAPPPGKPKLDPAAWGSDHVGQPLSRYTESGECLFCHRGGGGRNWQTHKHNRAMRRPQAEEPALAALKNDPATMALAEQVEFVVGDTRAQRFLKSSEAYGKVDLLSTMARFGRGARARLEATANPRWDSETFALACAGCHATAVDPETHAFSAPYIDCFACHGEPPADHANDAKLAFLSKARKDSPAVVTSICASCHVRFGKSKSSGLPYPTSFVAGDNLFKDFEVDWKAADDPKLNPADAHVMQNVRDVVLHGNEATTCLSCHDVHADSSAKHRDLPATQYCNLCHSEPRPIKSHKTYQVKSERCKY